jgi:SAM-dependent methyltransferase
MNAPAKGVTHKVKRLLMRIRRKVYSLRAFIPGLRERHRLEAMVGPLGYWDQLQQYHLRLLCANGLRPGQTLLDIGCGPLQGGVAFIRYLNRGGYTGIDIDPVRIDAARAQIARHKLAAKEPRVFLSSSFGNDELDDATFDYIWASQILCYLNEATMARLFAAIKRRLKRDGHFLGDTLALDHFEFTHPEHPGKYVRHTHESLSALAAQHGLAVSRLGTIGDYGYPRRLSLRTNPLFDVTHAGSQPPGASKLSPGGQEMGA